MSKAILFSDTHFSPIKGMELFVDTPINCVNNILDYAESEKIENIFILGDTVNSKDIIENYLLVKIKPTIERFKKFNTISIVGNHDLVMKYNSSYNLMSLFDQYIEVVKDPYVVKEFDGNKFVFCNYVGNHLIGNEELPEAKVLFSHMDCNGFFANAQYEVKGCDVDPYNLRMFEQVFSGHYHKRSKMRNICYIGNTHHMRRNDVGNPCGFVVLDLKTLKYEFRNYIDYQPPCFYEHSISSEKIKKLKNGFIRIVIDEEEDEEVNSAVLKDLKQFLIETNKNHSVDFVYKRNKEVTEITEEEKLEDEIIKSNDLGDMFKSYVDNVKTELDKKRLIKTIV